MPRPIRATIDLAAFRHNYARARRVAGTAPTWAVIKANAYGHGLLRCAQAVADIAHGYAMLDFADAVALREAGLTHPLLMLEGAFEAADVALASRLALTLTVHDPAQLQMLDQAPGGRPIDVYLKFNSGMNRLGFPLHAFDTTLARVRGMPGVGRIGLMTHFACADEAGGLDAQWSRFRAATAACDLPLSVANSAALLTEPALALGGARPGIMLYGASPMPGRATAAALDLRPVMRLDSRLIGVQVVQPGEAVGYGATFVADRAMRVGVVACGYADGYPRHAPTGTPILVDGVRTRTLGRVSMDMLACDLSEVPQADVGAPVQLWGEYLPADEVAAAAGTISYELFCALAPRVPVSVIGA